jgi:hypothetical protein
MRKGLTLGAVLLFAALVYGQTTQKPKSGFGSGQQQAEKKDPPTLGFNHTKDVRNSSCAVIFRG